jgi:hypothetical protein
MSEGKKILLLAMSGALLTACVTNPPPRWGSEPAPRQGVCFYEDVDYRGDYFCVRSGEELPSLPSELNDRLSSLRVFGGAQVVVYRNDGFSGRSVRFDADVPNLRYGDWNDRISSVRVRSWNEHPAGRPDDDRDEHHGNRADDDRYQAQHREDADRIVRRAYQDVLGREPDQPGLRLYRDRILDEGWTEKRVRDALRNSPEYREKAAATSRAKVETSRAQAEEVVRRAYLSVLSREPDAGSKGYVEKILRNHWTQTDVEKELRKSAEYRNKHKS